MKKRFAVVAMALVAVLLAAKAQAGTGGTEYQTIYSTLVDWTQGGLGKAIAACAFITGIAMGVVQQSLMAVVLGLSTAIAVNYTPTIIDSIVTALIG